MSTQWKNFQLEKFHPPWWLRSGHAQTLYSALSRCKPKFEYSRVRLLTPDQDFLDIDIVEGKKHAPVIIAVHGLEGGSQSGYIIRLMNQVYQHNWTGIAINQRGCSGETNRLPRSYHVGEIQDFDLIINYITQQFPEHDYFLAGYSLGANIVAKWLGEKGETIPHQCKAAVLCAGGYHVHEAEKHMDQGLNLLYVYCFLYSLRRKVLKKSIQYPELIQYHKIYTAFTLKAFDEAYTSKIHGFKNALDYYTKSSSVTGFQNIHIPTLLIHALSDPLIPYAALPKQEYINPNTTLIRFIRKGGHVGFYDKQLGFNWLDRQILRWFNVVHPEH